MATNKNWGGLLNDELETKGDKTSKTSVVMI